jgi:molybdopterin-guanine dinucleotide biosynthesis protein A
MGGRPKSFLEVGGRSVLDRQLEVLRPLFGEILIVANDAQLYERFGLPVVPDVVSGQPGPLAGILSAVESAQAPAVLCLACDMPFLAAEALRLVRDRAPEAEVVVPEVAGRAEPLFARYARTVGPAIRAQLSSGDYKVSRFFDRVRTVRIEEQDLRAVDPALRFLANVNTPEELADWDAGGPERRNL